MSWRYSKLAWHVPSTNAVELAGDGPALGRADAPLTIVEYRDFECPSYRRLHQQTLPAFKERYIDRGQVCLVFRHLPSSGMHPNAVGAAAAPKYAGEQG